MTKIAKKILSLFLAVIMILGTATLGISGVVTISLNAKAVSNYSGTAAATYAKNWWDSRNTSVWADYDPWGGDCANFVAQSIYNGGIPMTPKWYFHKRTGQNLNALSTERTESFTMANGLKGHTTEANRSLYRYLISIGGELIKNPSASDLSVGDVLFYDWSINGHTPDGLYNHCAICTDIINGIPQVACHYRSKTANYDKLTTNWTLGEQNKNIAVIKLHGTPCVNTMPGYDVYKVTTSSGIILRSSPSTSASSKGVSAGYDFVLHVTETKTVGGYIWGKCKVKGIEGWLRLSGLTRYVTHVESIPVDHVWGEWYVVSKPTCVDKGLEKRNCQRCGLEQERVTECSGHKEIVPATCLDKSYCSACGALVSEALGHDYGEWQTHIPATCLEGGQDKHICKRCGHTEYRDTNALGHNYEATVKLPYCETAGETFYKCSRCGDSYTDRSEWSAWTTLDDTSVLSTLPSDIYESKTQYRYSDRYFTYSDWTTTPIANGNGYTVETQTKDTTYHWGYKTFIYCTRDYNLKRQYRNYSIEGQYSKYNVDPNYGEYHWELDVSLDEINNATQIAPGAWMGTNISKDQPGYNKGNATGYALVYNASGYVGCAYLGDPIYKGSKTTEYRKKITNWKPFTEWSDTAVSGSESRNVETRTVYRFKQAALNHDDVYSKVERTCYEDGCTRATCQRCGRTYDTEIVPKGNHVIMGDWYRWTPENINNPDIIVYRRDCKTTPGCDYYELKELNITRKVIEPNCTADGYTLVTITDDSGDVLAEYEEEGSRIPALGHDMGEYKLIKAPTCTEKGLEEAKCQRNGCKHKEQRDIDPLGHIEVVDPAVAPTCTVTGLTKGSHCSRCENVVVPQEIVPATGHNPGNWIPYEPEEYVNGQIMCNGIGTDRRYCQNNNCDYFEERYIEGPEHNFVVVDSKDATCTLPGFIQEECSRCGMPNTTFTIEPLGHIEGEEYTVYPTCLDDGFTGWDCQREGCDHTERIKEHPATDHDFDEEYCASTCTSGGYYKYTCKNIDKNTNIPCGYTYEEGLDPLGHTWGEWYVVTPATCELPGLEKRECIRTDAEETRVIAPIGHNYKPHEIEPDCENGGGTEYICQNDPSHTYIDGITPELGHDWGDWVTKTEPGCITEGVKERVCNRDPSHIETGKIPALGHATVTDEGKAPTCTEGGITEGVHCTRCNTVITKPEDLDKLGHDWGEWDIKEPTCEEDGYKKRVCKRDSSHVEEEILEKTDHTTEIIPAVTATCYDPGKTEGLVCTVCNKVLVEQEVIPKLDHDWGDWEEIDSECTKDGSRKRICNRDSSHIEEEIIPSTGHNVVTDEGKEATCLETGLTEGSHCTTCNTVIVPQEVIPALGHDWGEWSRVEPTCEEDGYEKRVCGRDPSHVETVVIPATGHISVTDEAVPATCTETGLTEGSHCSVCSKELVAQEVVPELGHDWDEWKTEKEPDCENDGEQKRICKRDASHVETGTIPALGHTVVIDVPSSATCLESGKTAGSHCSVCDKVLEKVEYTSPLGHDWGEWDIKDATCEEAGYKHRVCNRDSSHIDHYDYEPLGHTPETLRGYEPTCTEDGLTDGSVCSTCDKVLVEQEVIPALGHDWGDWEVIESTCVSVGSKKRVCNRDSSHVEEEIVPGPLPHDAVIDEGYSATCTETGLTEGAHCGYCNKVIIAQEVIPALGHDWGEWDIKDATCEEDGYKERVCNRDSSHVEHEDILHTDHTAVIDPAVPATCTETGLTEGAHCSSCGKTLVAQEVVPALNHDWGEWKTTIEPGCLTKGEKKSVCNRDASHVKTEEIPALGHTVVDEDSVPATCLESGKTEGAHCSVCNAVIEKSDYIAPLGHDWGEWEIKDATCTEDGYMHRVCNRDPSHVEHKVIKAHGHTPESIPAVEATCLETGLTEGSYCVTCDEVLVEQQVTDALGHDWGKWEEIDSECTKDGSRKRICNRDSSHIEEEIIPSTGHNVVTDEGKEATCLETGLTEGSHCTTCNTVIVAQEIIPALGHDWGEWDIKDATCTENGYKNRICNRDSSHTEGEILYATGHVTEIDTGYSATCTEPGLSQGSHCSVCNEILIAQEVIPALDHDWAEWYTVSQPDCLNDGKQERICNRDNSHVETVAIPALGHTVVIDPAVAPTCTESGSTAGSHCSVCDGVIEKIEMLDPLGHEMGEWYVVKPADYGVEGLEQRDCIRSDKSETRPIPALVKNTYTATFVIGDEVIGTVTFEEGAKIIEEPPIPKKDNYIGSWEDYVLGNEDIVINGYYEPIDPDKTSELEEEKVAEYKDGVAKITLRAQADTKAINIISESVKPVDVVLVLDQSGSMDEKLGSEKKIDALVEAANIFVDDIYANAVATGADHRVAVVGFAMGSETQNSKDYPKYMNTAVLTTGGKPVGYLDAQANGATVYKNALMRIVGEDGKINQNVKGVLARSNFEPKGATAADLGLEMADSIFDHNPVDTSERQRIVVFITDGVPTTWDETETNVVSVAKTAISAAKNIKAVTGEGAKAAKIYSVGIASGIDPAANFMNTNNGGWSRTDGFDFNRFLHYVSSNYPAAEAMNNGNAGDKTGGFYLAADDTEKLQSIFDGILYSSVYAVTTFDKVTLVDTVSADFTMTMEQEEAFRNQLAAEKGLGDDDITITRNEDGTTTIRVDNVKAEKVYDDDGKAYYKAELSFEVTANKNALEKGEYETNTEDAGIIIDGNYAEKFDIPTVIISESRNIVVFTINDNVYRIDEGQLGDSITVPESDLAKWDIPEDAVITDSYMEIEASEICQDEYTITWKINEETIVTKHKIGSEIEAVEVPDPSTELEFAGWSPALRSIMPAKNLVYTATFKTKHIHNFVAMTYTGDCESGITTYYECACGAKKEETSASSEHQYEALVNNTKTTVIDEIKCKVCGKSNGQTIKYSCSYQTAYGWRTQTVNVDLYEAGVKVQIGEDEKIYIMIPIDESLANKTFTVKRIPESGPAKTVNCTPVNGYLIFEADHFSIYNIMVVDPETGLPYEELTYEQSMCALNGHTIEEEIVAPTCVSDGYTKQTCTNCGYFTYTDELPATGHTFTDTTVAPDCTNGGYVEHVCDDCGHTFKDTETEKLGHDYKAEVTAPTCTLDGYTLYTCSRCEHCYKADDVAKLNHSYKSTVIAATCTAAGYTLFVCENCGYDYIDNHTAALGHSYVDTTVESTCTGEGYVSHVCSRCSDTYIDSTTAAAGHSYKKTVVAATCTQGGYTVNECTGCGYSYRSDATPAAGHNASGEWVVKDGKHVQLCTKCNEVAESKDISINSETIVSGKNLVIFYKMTKNLEVIASEGKVIYHSADPGIARVDENGNVKGMKRGETEITATVEGTDVSVTCKVEVRYTWWQWLIMIFMLGFLWY